MITTTAPDLTISVVGNNIVHVTPAGGNALFRKKKSVKWINSTNQPIGLFFTELADVDDTGDEDPIWPFSNAVESATVKLDVAKGVVRVGAGASFQGTIALSGLVYLKYSVAVLEDLTSNSKNSNYVELDPIIIIDR